MNGLCFRCEYRAIFLETGSGPRNQCGDINNTVHSCYQHRPVKPVSLLKDKKDIRPQFGPAMISSRSSYAGVSEFRLNLAEQKDGSILYWTPKSLDEKHLKAQSMLWFFYCHPALESPIHGPFELLSIEISNVCKNGYTNPMKGMVNLYYTPERYKKFKAEFDKEFKECSEFELKCKSLISIDIPYEKLYGEKWCSDHIEYWGSLSPLIFLGKDFKDQYNYKKWQRYSGVEAKGSNFEELIINLGTKFKKIFGDYNKDDFLTPKETKNNKGKPPFIFKEVKDSKIVGRISKKNPEYINLSESEINRRWLMWFSKTPYCKKNWPKIIEKTTKVKQ
jgi:hypothetical protein